MKRISTFLLLAVLFSGSSVFAQKNTVTAGLFYLPISETKIGHASLAYYRSRPGNCSLGLKGMFSTDAIGAKEDDVRISVANVDLVNRWTFAKLTRRYKWNFEAGLSVAWTLEKIPPRDNLWYCNVGASAEQILEMKKYYEEVLSKWHVERNFYPGIATASSWEFALSKHFSLGAGLNMNVYFSPKDGWRFLPLPNLNAAYSF